MRYYRIRQDRHLRNRITFQDLEGCPNLVFDKETIRDFKRSSVLYVRGIRTVSIRICLNRRCC